MAGFWRRRRLPSWRWMLPRRWAVCCDTGVPLTPLRGLCLLEVFVRCRCRFQLPAGAGAGAVFAPAAPVAAADRPPLAVPEVAVAYPLPTLSTAAAVLSILVACTRRGAAVVAPGHRCRQSCSPAVGDASDAGGTLLLAADVSTCCLAAQSAELLMSMASPCCVLPCCLHETNQKRISHHH